jgi:hypothetical protein
MARAGSSTSPCRITGNRPVVATFRHDCPASCFQACSASSAISLAWSAGMRRPKAHSSAYHRGGLAPQRDRRRSCPSVLLVSAGDDEKPAQRRALSASAAASRASAASIPIASATAIVSSALRRFGGQPQGRQESDRRSLTHFRNKIDLARRLPRPRRLSKWLRASGERGCAFFMMTVIAVT